MERRSASLFGLCEKGAGDQDARRNGNARVGHVEAGEVVYAPMEIEHVHHETVVETVDQVAEDPRIHTSRANATAANAASGQT